LVGAIGEHRGRALLAFTLDVAAAIELVPEPALCLFENAVGLAPVPARCAAGRLGAEPWRVRLS